MRQVTVAVLCVLLWMVSPWPSYAEELVSREADWMLLSCRIAAAP